MKFWLCVLALALSSTLASAQQAFTFDWDASTGTVTPTGYLLFSGPTSGSEDQAYDVGLTLTALLTFDAGTYFLHVRAYTPDGRSLDTSNEVVVTVTPSPVPVDCVGAWSGWVATSPWSACVNNRQIQTQARTFHITTPAQNGGAACEVPDGTVEPRTLEQACTVTIPSCAADPLTVDVKDWPTRRTEPVFTSNYPVVSARKSTHGQTVTSILFTDVRGCTARKP